MPSQINLISIFNQPTMQTTQILCILYNGFSKQFFAVAFMESASSFWQKNLFFRNHNEMLFDISYVDHTNYYVSADHQEEYVFVWVLSKKRTDQITRRSMLMIFSYIIFYSYMFYAFHRSKNEHTSRKSRETLPHNDHF